MKLLTLVLTLCLLTGCAAAPQQAEPLPESQPAESATAETIPVMDTPSEDTPYVSRFDEVTEIHLSDDTISVDGAGETEAVYTSHDIIFYENMDAYESGNPYGEGEDWEKHTQAEADSHRVVNITAPGAYRLTGKLSAGQIRVDLGEEAFDDPNAVVELILNDADISCSVAPAILFMNVYECDGDWSAETAKSIVDTSEAGANLVLEGENTVVGSHVAKIFKDNDEEKKLWKQDGAIYSYMSMNVFGPGKLDITADNEGLDTELHLTINGGEIAIRSDNDGINTNEDGVSVTTINGGNLHIIAGLGAEGDGIDSNGYLVINGGTVVASANPGADAGLDSDLGSFVNGGTVIALGSTMDWAESDSEQVTMNLQFAENQSAEAAVVVTRADGTVIFAYDPSADEVLAENRRVYSGAVISCGNFHVDETYHVYVDGEITGEDLGGIYDVTTVTDFSGGKQMTFTGTDVMMRPGGMGFGGGQRPEDFDPSEVPEGMQMGERPEKPEGKEPPEGMEMGEKPEMPEGWEPGAEVPEPPEGWEPGEMPEGMELPDDFDPSQIPEGGFDGRGQFTAEPGDANMDFYMQDKVNFFSGLTSQ